MVAYFKAVPKLEAKQVSILGNVSAIWRTREAYHARVAVDFRNP